MGGGQQQPTSLMTFEGLMNAEAMQKQGQWWQQQLLGNKPQQPAAIPRSMMLPTYDTYSQPDMSAYGDVSATDLATPPMSLYPMWSQPDAYSF